MIRVALGQFRALDAQALEFAAQLGASGVTINSPLLPTPWRSADLSELRRRCESFGLRLEAIENLPHDVHRPAIVGGDGQSDAIAAFAEAIRAASAAGVPILGFHWMADGAVRTSFETEGRGGARVSSFAQPDEPTRPRLADDVLWSNFRRFVDEVLPIAEANDVRLSLHPDDPPVAAIGSIARLFRSVDALESAMVAYPSRHLGVTFCLGTVSAMGADPLDAIGRLAPHACYVHFRDVTGTATCFRECFLGEGNFDPAAAMHRLVEAGFDGFLIDDHAPHLLGDPAPGQWPYVGHAHATGYLQGLLTGVRG